MNEVNNQSRDSITNIQPDNSQNINQMPQQGVPNVQPNPVPQPEQPRNTGNQLSNQPSNNNKKSSSILKTLIICITIIVVVALIGLVVFLLKGNSRPNESKSDNNTPKTEETTDNTNNQNAEQNEVEVSNPDSYKYLIDRLEKIRWCKVMPLNKYINMDNLSNEIKLGTAIGNIDDNGSILAYNLSDVESELKKIYGKNTFIKPQNFSVYKYDEKNKEYILPDGVGCPLLPELYQSIERVTRKDNRLYVYANVGYYFIDNNHNEQLCNDYISDDEIHSYYEKNSDLTASCISLKSIDKKYYKNDSVDLEQYIKDNKNTFAEYKYTFEKEDNNYIIKGLEKVK